MSVAEWINTVGSAIVVASTIVFMVTYHLLAPWRSSAMGRHLMLFAGAIGGLGAYTVVIAIVGQEGCTAAVLRVVRALILLLIAGLFVQRTVMVVRVQRRDSKDSP